MPKNTNETTHHASAKTRRGPRLARAGGATDPKRALVVSMSPDCKTATIWLGAAGSTTGGGAATSSAEGVPSRRRPRARLDGG